MLIPLHLREYDDADIITFLHELPRMTRSRVIREAIRLRMQQGASDDVAVPVTASFALVESPAVDDDADEIDTEMMLGRLVGAHQTGDV